MTVRNPILTRALTAAVLALTLGACGSPTGQYEPQPLGELEPPFATTVSPGDVVSIEFWQQPELSRDRIVDDDGMIQVPLLRGVKVEGLSAEQIREELTRLYRQFYSDPLIVVTVKLGVNVTGAVENPGRYTVDPSFDLFDALGLAGGLEFEGKQSGIFLYRGGSVYQIDINDAALATDPNKLRLQSGDWIFVETRFWTLTRIGAYATIAVLILTITNFFVK